MIKQPENGSIIQNVHKMKKLVIATRSSQLALQQADWVKVRINRLFPHVDIRLCRIKTKGDAVLDAPLAKIGGKGLFVKELEVAILNREADIAVHSMKDVPVELPAELEISVVAQRENPSDAFVSNRFSSFFDLPKNGVVGTSSLRRIAQLRAARPDLRFESLRGNVNTRLKKLDDGDYDAIILAAAGLKRLGMADRIAEELPFAISLPAIGQGAIGIESRIGDAEVRKLIEPLNDADTMSSVKAERALLCRLNAGCQVPLAGFATLEKGTIALTGMVAAESGKTVIRHTETGAEREAEKIGVKVAEGLLAKGAGAILADLGIDVP